MWVVCVMVGSVASLGAVWTFADIANALMAVPNLISLLVLAPVIVLETKTHLWDEQPPVGTDDDAAKDTLAKHIFEHV
jgi:alanine or glycine:cation symporter, AGCS family